MKSEGGGRSTSERAAGKPTNIMIADTPGMKEGGGTANKGGGKIRKSQGGKESNGGSPPGETGFRGGAR